MSNPPPDYLDKVDATSEGGYLPTIVEDQHLPGYDCGYSR